MKLLIIIIVIVLIVVIIYHPDIILERFSAKREDNDGNMSFDYLTDPDYKENILARYYINDDVLVNGARLVDHPYQFKQLGPDGKLYYGDYVQNIAQNNRYYLNYGIRL